MKKSFKKALTVLLTGIAATTPALAASTTGTVGKIEIHNNFSYDEFTLTGNQVVCPTLSGDWRFKVRMFRDTPGYESALKVLMAAKLSGKQVYVDANTGTDRCVLDHIHLLE